LVSTLADNPSHRAGGAAVIAIEPGDGLREYFRSSLAECAPLNIPLRQPTFAGVSTN
jgi:hypothetical protein